MAERLLYYCSLALLKKQASREESSTSGTFNGHVYNVIKDPFLVLSPRIEIPMWQRNISGYVFLFLHLMFYRANFPGFSSVQREVPREEVWFKRADFLHLMNGISFLLRAFLHHHQPEKSLVKTWCGCQQNVRQAATLKVSLKAICNMSFKILCNII